MRLSLADINSRLTAGATVSELVDAQLARIEDPQGQGRVAFVRASPAVVRLAATAIDLQRAAEAPITALTGATLGVKDLFDVAGEETRAGGLRPLGPPCERDAVAVAHLRRAGMIYAGRTNMTEFAYSGLGLNPHHGTPLSPWRRHERRIAGGSTSGGAAAVADGMISVALGSDTGGSCRIPAAFCGLVGFKPTQGRVSREGMIPLSTSLDSVGWIANTVDCCAAVDAVLTGEISASAGPTVETLRLWAPTNYVLDDLDPEVEAAFEASLAKLAERGAHIERRPLPELEQVGAFGVQGGFPAAESFAWHRERLKDQGASYDPRVRSRILRGAGQSAADYIDLLRARAVLITAFAARVEGYDAIVFPTAPMAPPRLDDLQDDDAFTRINLLALRNSTVVNMVDGCAINLPISLDPPVGLTLAAVGGRDHALLAMASRVETVLADV